MYTPSQIKWYKIGLYVGFVSGMSISGIVALILIGRPFDSLFMIFMAMSAASLVTILYIADELRSNSLKRRKKRRVSDNPLREHDIDWW